MKSKILYLYTYMIVNILSYVLILRIVEIEDMITYSIYVAILPIFEVINGLINGNLIISMKKPSNFIFYLISISLSFSAITSILIILYFYNLGLLNFHFAILLFCIRIMQSFNSVQLALGERYMLFGRNAFLRVVASIFTLIFITLFKDIIKPEYLALYRDLMIAFSTFIIIAVFQPYKNLPGMSVGNKFFLKRHALAIIKRGLGFNASQISTIFMTRFPIFVLSFVMPAYQFVILMQAQYLSNLFNAVINPLTEKLLFILRTNYKQIKLTILDNFIIWFFPISIIILILVNYYGEAIISLSMGEKWLPVQDYLLPILIITMTFICINYRKHILIAKKRFVYISVFQVVVGAAISKCWYSYGFKSGLEIVYLILLICMLWVFYEDFKEKITNSNH